MHANALAGLSLFSYIYRIHRKNEFQRNTKSKAEYGVDVTHKCMIYTLRRFLHFHPLKQGVVIINLDEKWIYVL